MKEIAAALREAALMDVPSGFRTHLRSLADSIDSGIDWRSVAIALCVKYGTARGTALVGSGSIAWARDVVTFRVERDGDALRLVWDSPPLNGERAPTSAGTDAGGGK